MDPHDWVHSYIMSITVDERKPSNNNYHFDFGKISEPITQLIAYNVLMGAQSCLHSVYLPMRNFERDVSPLDLINAYDAHSIKVYLVSGRDCHPFTFDGLPSGLRVVLIKHYAINDESMYHSLEPSFGQLQSLVLDNIHWFTGEMLMQDDMPPLIKLCIKQCPQFNCHYLKMYIELNRHLRILKVEGIDNSDVTVLETIMRSSKMLVILVIDYLGTEMIDPNQLREMLPALKLLKLRFNGKNQYFKIET